MAFITKSDLASHYYTEKIDVITRGDDMKVDTAIDAAIAETKGYLGAFDTDAIFATTDKSRHALLLTFTKDIAIWHLIVICNAGADIELRQARYERAIKWLEKVQKGDIAADLPTAKDDDGNATGGTILFGSNDQRTNHF